MLLMNEEGGIMNLSDTEEGSARDSRIYPATSLTNVRGFSPPGLPVQLSEHL